MKTIYITDLHGHKGKYKKTLDLAIKNDVDMVINGADMLPKGNGNLHRAQEKFLSWLDAHFAEYENNKIYYLCMLGNDDLAIYDKEFNKICDKYKYIINMAQKYVTIRDCEYIGCNLVTDYPFRCKDRCRRDGENFVFPRQYSTALYSTPTGFEYIPDWFEEANSKPSLMDELNALPKPIEPRKTVYIIHMPPSGLGFDHCSNGQIVGSDAVLKFIGNKKPFLACFGHIHESPDITGKWMQKIDETTYIQPGQSSKNKLTYVLMDFKNKTFERKLIVV